MRNLNLLGVAERYMDFNIVIVIPAYNEGERIAEVLQKTFQYFDSVVVVDDNSVDDTAKLAESFGAEVIRLENNNGAGFATRHGCDYAFTKLGAQIVVTIDADGQHAPEDIPLLIDVLLKEDCDVVFGYRLKKKNMPLVKKIGNFILSKLAFILFKVKLVDTLTGFHAFSVQSYPLLRWESNRYGFVSEFVFRIYLNKLSYGEVAVQTIYNDKRGGMRKRDGIKSIFLMFGWRLKSIVRF